LKIPARCAEPPSTRAKTFAIAAFNLGSRRWLVGRGIEEEVISPADFPPGGPYEAFIRREDQVSSALKTGLGEGGKEAAAIRSSVSKFTSASLWSTAFDGEDEDETDPPLCDCRNIARVVTIFKRKAAGLNRHGKTRTRTQKKAKNEEDQSLTQTNSSNWVIMC
jgi:hypothetical protein